MVLTGVRFSVTIELVSVVILFLFFSVFVCDIHYFTVKVLLIIAILVRTKICPVITISVTLD